MLETVVSSADIWKWLCTGLICPVSACSAAVLPSTPFIPSGAACALVRVSGYRKLGPRIVFQFSSIPLPALLPPSCLTDRNGR